MVVKIKKKAYKQIYGYCKAAEKGEIGGLMLGEIDNFGDVIVNKVILLDQLRNGASFELTEEGMMDFTKNSDAKTLKSVLGWWHYHVEHGTFWSPEDNSTFRKLAELSNFCLGVVTSITKDLKEGEMDMRCRLDTYRYDGTFMSIDNIECEIDEPKFFKYNWSKIKSEVKEKVKEDNRYYIICPHCKGSGTIQKVKNETKTKVSQHDEALGLSKAEIAYLDSLSVDDMYGFN